MNSLKIMSVVGSAVPQSLRERGLLACWYLVNDGEPVSGPFASLTAAQTTSQQLEQARADSLRFN
ncbi:hypothetical protein [Pseudomonas syringae]|uniref:Filamentous hemagglutinin n=1 Tax=Pseudomonas syringae TaxID=317 RepID=A0A085VQ24_PSESX|nr:hypothetical protein [Pseudomonas syringae]KFE57537.1 filamentous hemagglutinin [Pseudomonas syringae]